jgi:hypothetical protein
LLAGVCAFAVDARAEWPPPADATPDDFKNGKYWPNDPSYGYDPTTFSNGQWNFYSFIPNGNDQVVTGESAAGMSIDLAWRYTIGDPGVLIVVTDSGIEWDNADLIEKVYLNYKELVNHKPTHADGSACGGAGDLVGFDCNGDGILTVSDYADTPGVSDVNGNGVLDAGDLIQLFSDGVDDDHNGYIDDIAGWDFMKDDNNPYDDTRYGHGTGEARDSTAQTNNQIDDAGVCPLCRFVPTRVGDSFITDSTLFGKAVVYAVDNGASIVQCALGTLNMNAFAQTALDYAYTSGVLSINSMADEDSRHHNMPTVANHTLPVHAIEYDSSTIVTSTTFTGFNPCSNYGGHNFLSASGTSCSSEATGKLSGIAGLVVSAARQYQISPPLTPGELQSIFFTTTDDIDVASSRMANPRYAWSQKGFDQRFGYGRVNANAAVEAVKNLRIPPSVDVTSPTWYSILYKDQAMAPINIQGSVSANRATSYDYVVEWAPGVQPMDDEYTTLTTSAPNIPASMPTTGTLGTIDPRVIDPTHPRDVDSPNGENDTAITVRVRATAHYGGAVGEVQGEMRRTYYVQSDPTLVKGFPIYLGSSGEQSPKMADLDGDGVRDLIMPTSGGVLHVYKITPSGPQELPGFPFLALPEDGLLEPVPTPDTPSYLSAPAYANGAVDPTLAREPFGIAPAIGDVDGDGEDEIILTTYSGSVYAVDRHGQLKAGFPVRLPLVPSCPLPATDPPDHVCMDELHSRIARGAFAAPVLADLDGDGVLDIVVAGFDGDVYAFDGAGQPLPGWPVTSVHYTGSFDDGIPTPRNRVLSTPAVGDFNGDGLPEVIVGSNEKIGNGGAIGAAYMIDGRGMNAPGGAILPGWPYTITSLPLFPLVAEGVPNASVVGHFGDTLASVTHGNGSAPFIVPVNPGVQASPGGTPTNALPALHDDPTEANGTWQGLYPTGEFGPLSKAAHDVMFPLFAQPSLGDLDQDGTLDIVSSGGSLSLAGQLMSSTYTTTAGQNLLAMWSGKTGKMMLASPIVLEDFTFFNNQAIVDLNGDGYPEVITGTGGYFLHAYDACGNEPTGWPKFTGQWIISTPALGDLDGDGTLEVAVASRDGWLYAWHTDATEDSTIEWESFHHDNKNTGNYDTPLDQGGGKKAAKPLTADMCVVHVSHDVPVAGVSPGGGCDCRAAAGDAPGESGAAAVVAAGALLMASRRRRRRAA